MANNAKNVLVTGGAGFIGSNLCDELVKRGNNVLCIDNFSTGSQKNIDHLLQSTNFEFINHDLTQPINLEEYREAQKFKTEFYGISEIYHLACPVASTQFEKYSLATLLANSHATKNVLDIALKYNSKVFFASSSSVYGESYDNNFFVDEKYQGIVSNLSERGIYDEGKRFAESMCYTYNKVNNLDVKIGRIFSTFGPRMQINSGVFMADAIISALNNEKIITNYKENDVGSFCYVKDTIECILLIMETGKFGPYNIGNPEAIKIAQIVNIIKKIIGSNSEIEYNPNAKNRLIPDIGLVKEKFGWFPLTLLEDALRDTIDYMKAAKNSFNAGDFFKEDKSYEAKLKESTESIEKNKSESNIFRMIFKG